MVVTHSLVINEDRSWVVFIHGHKLELKNLLSTPLSSVPSKLDAPDWPP